jgi:hypothetical protein
MRSFLNYRVEKRDGSLEWYTANRGALIRRGPQVNKGKVKLGGADYTVIPKFNRPHVGPRFWFSPWPLEENIYADFVESIPTQMPFYRMFPQVKEIQEAIATSAETIAEAGERKLISEYIHPALNWGMLILAAFGGIGIGAIIMSIVQRLGK